MTIQSIRQHQKWLAPAAILLTLVGVYVARTAFAGVRLSNTMFPVCIMADNGRRVTVAGPISSFPGDRIELRVRVTQRSTGAVAEGVAFLTAIGTGTVQRWEVEAHANGGETFEVGPATSVAFARVSGKATDAHQWLVNISLVKE